MHQDRRQSAKPALRDILDAHEFLAVQLPQGAIGAAVVPAETLR
jgi:hypothetical protein